MGCPGVAAICQHEVDQSAVLVDGTKQILPPTAYPLLGTMSGAQSAATIEYAQRCRTLLPLDSPRQTTRNFGNVTHHAEFAARMHPNFEQDIHLTCTTSWSESA